MSSPPQAPREKCFLYSEESKQIEREGKRKEFKPTMGRNEIQAEKIKCYMNGDFLYHKIPYSFEVLNRPVISVNKKSTDDVQTIS